MPDYHLAQLNIAQMRAPIESPEMATFAAELDRINALAEASPGFVWRLKTDDGNATALRPFGDDMLVNLSVWTDVESLRHFVYETAHVEILRRREEWFSRMRGAYAVMWWVPAGTTPDTDEARERLERLKDEGPGPAAFTFARAFPPPGV